MGKSKITPTSDSHVTWEEFTIDGMNAVQLHITHKDWSSIAAATAMMWNRVFDELSGRVIHGLDVEVLPDLGFNFYPHCVPQKHSLRLEIAIERMEEDCCETDERAKQLLEEAWTALEEGLSQSGVLKRKDIKFQSDFVIRCGEFPSKEFSRTIVPRTE